jgi:hypothetical protein
VLLEKAEEPLALVVGPEPPDTTASTASAGLCLAYEAGHDPAVDELLVDQEAVCPGLDDELGFREPALHIQLLAKVALSSEPSTRRNGEQPAGSRTYKGSDDVSTLPHGCFEH